MAPVPVHASGSTGTGAMEARSEEHTSELQSQSNLVCRLLLEKKKQTSHSSSPSTAAATSSTTTNVRPSCASSSVEPTERLTRVSLGCMSMTTRTHAVRHLHES